MIIIKRVTNLIELEGIKKLQNENLYTLLDQEEIQKEGFLTAEYTLDYLEKMHQVEPSIIAKDKEKVVGYALVTTRETANQHDLLDDLFRNIDSKLYNGVRLKDVNYVVVGQLCVAKEYRGQGLVQRMYAHFQEQLSDQYNYLITDINERNPRSVKAHLKSGFKIIDSLVYGGYKWHIVLWDWRN